MSKISEKDINPFDEMARIANTSLGLPTLGFKESFRSAKPGKLIYDSEQCRINLVWGGWDYGVGNSISIYYGRLHAPNEEAIMIWNDEICHCWHEFHYVLHFLDKRAPVEAADLNYSHHLTRPFYEQEYRQKYSRNQPEWLAKMHVTIWQYYGRRFFELFDLRQPDLWQQYQKFLKEVYDIEGRIPEIDPPMDKVC